jgi:hypothetical protein
MHRILNILLIHDNQLKICFTIAVSIKKLVGATELEIENAIKHWFSGSGDRNGGREKRRKHGVSVQKQTRTEDQ